MSSARCSSDGSYGTRQAEMADLELAAVPSAEPTPYVHEVIASARDSGRILRVVSFRAVNAYSSRHGLTTGSTWLSRAPATTRHCSSPTRT
jgi:hypothetical protein